MTQELKELVSLIGKEQTKYLLELLNGKDCFFMEFDSVKKSFKFRGYNSNETIEIIPISIYAFDVIFLRAFKFYDYRLCGYNTISISHTLFNAQPYLQILKDL